MKGGRCDLYILGHEHSIFGHALKVGVSSNIGARINELQTGSCERLKLYFSFSLPSRSLAMEAEAMFHDLFDDSSIRGEWFGMHPDRALFMASLVVVRVLSRHYRPPEISRVRAESGLLDAFAEIDSLPDELQSELIVDWGVRAEA